VPAADLREHGSYYVVVSQFREDWARVSSSPSFVCDCLAHLFLVPSPWCLCSASGGVFAADQVGSNLSAAIKQMDLDKHPEKDLIINEILVMRASHHANIVNYIDSFLYKDELWVVMEYMEGGSLTDVVTAILMTEGQIAAVSRETARGLQYLHKLGVIHRDIKSSHVLLSLAGDIKLSTHCITK
jgi:serine/threonine protein kinase